MLGASSHQRLATFGILMRPWPYPPLNLMGFGEGYLNGSGGGIKSKFGWLWRLLPRGKEWVEYDVTFPRCGLVVMTSAVCFFICCCGWYSKIFCRASCWFSVFGFSFSSSGSSITCVETCDFALTNRDGGRVLVPGSLLSSLSLTGEDCLLVSIEMSSPAFVCGCSYEF